MTDVLKQLGQKRQPGRGGGYVKVYDDGKGKATYRDYDPVTGIKRELIYHGDGTMTNRVTQMLEPLKEYGKLVEDGFRKHSKKPLQQQCVVSMIDYFEMLKRCGWKPGTSIADHDEKRLDRIINDSNEHVIKTRPGRISMQKSKWY